MGTLIQRSGLAGHFVVVHLPAGVSSLFETLTASRKDFGILNHDLSNAGKTSCQCRGG